MEENKEKKLDGLVRKSVREVGLETPSNNFTEMLLSKIEVIPGKSVATTYQPLITRLGWGVIALIATGVSALILSGKVDTRLEWMESVNFADSIQTAIFDIVPEVTLSYTVIYSLLIFSACVVIQVLLLKHHLNKRYILH